MPKIVVHALMREGIFLESAVMIIIFWSCACPILLSVMADLSDVAIFLTVKALCESAVIMVELTILELTMEEQPFINQQIGLRWGCDIHN